MSALKILFSAILLFQLQQSFSQQIDVGTAHFQVFRSNQMLFHNS